MYRPQHFTEDRPDVLHALIRARPLAALVVQTGDGLQASHVPLQLVTSAPGETLLRGHVARANTLWRDYKPGSEALAIFQGADAYVSPAWYPSKREHGRVVPTWNYVVVQARGPLAIIEDRDWLRRLVGELSTEHEAARGSGWQVTDAPPAYIEQMLRAIVGFEMRVARLEGQWKLSQNRSAADHAGVRDALLGSGDTAAAEVGALMAADAAGSEGGKR